MSSYPSPDELLARVERVDLTRCVVDRDAVALALGRHLELLGLPRLPVRWAADVASGRSGCLYSRDSQAWWRARARARAAAKPPRADVEWDSLPQFRYADLWTAVAEAASSDRAALWRGGIEDTELGPNPVASWVDDALDWAAAPPALRGVRAVRRWIEACLPFVDAYESGLAFFWVLQDEIVAVPRPQLWIAGGALHRPDGPAVSWPGGQRFWFWRGIRVSRRTVETPEALTAMDIDTEGNAEVRRVMLERLGYERYLEARRARLLVEDGFGRLWDCLSPGEQEPLRIVEVVNATAEVDGSHKRYFLRVPPGIASPHAAIAWSFGFSDPRDYDPDVQT